MCRLRVLIIQRIILDFIVIIPYQPTSINPEYVYYVCSHIYLWPSFSPKKLYDLYFDLVPFAVHHIQISWQWHQFKKGMDASATKWSLSSNQTLYYSENIIEIIAVFWILFKHKFYKHGHLQCFIQVTIISPSYQSALDWL